MTDAAQPAIGKRMRLMAGLLVLLVLVGVIMALFSHSLRVFKVISGSMEPTILIGDRILVDAQAFPERFSIVAFQDPEKPNQPEEQIVKRIVGIEGDRIQVHGGILYLNGEEQYSSQVASNSLLVPDVRLRVPPGHFFVVGDNRNHSYDSFDFGPVPNDNLTGVLTIILWPPKRWGRVEEFESRVMEARTSSAEPIR